MTPEAPREELTSDESRLLDKLQRIYERAVDTAAASRRIVSVDDPRVVLARDCDERPVKYGGRVPSWDELRPSREELRGIQRLEDPVGGISIPALSLTTQADVARTLETPFSVSPFSVLSDFDLKADETGDLVEWHPENPKKGLKKEQRLDTKCIHRRRCGCRFSRWWTRSTG